MDETNEVEMNTTIAVESGCTETHAMLTAEERAARRERIRRTLAMRASARRLAARLETATAQRTQAADDWQEVDLGRRWDPRARRWMPLLVALPGAPDRERAGVGVTCTLDEVGVALGISRERARQIEARALRKLRKRFDGMAVVEALLETYGGRS